MYSVGGVVGAGDDSCMTCYTCPVQQAMSSFKIVTRKITSGLDLD